MKVRNILILAAGDSTRFWPLENKCFFKFLGQPFLVYLISSLINYTDRLFLVVNLLNKTKAQEMIKKYFPQDKIYLIEQKNSKKGMAGAILSARNKIKGETLIVNGSDYLNFDFLPNYLNFIKTEKFKVCLVGKSFDDYFPGGYFLFKKGKVIKIIEKPKLDQRPSKFVKLVFDFFFDIKDLIGHLEKINSSRDDVYERAVNLIIKNEDNTGFYPYNDLWQALKYPWHVLSMMEILLKKKVGNKVFIGKNVKLGKYSKIIGPAFIGDNSFIGDYTMIIKSHIGANCVIGGYSEVTRSYLGNGVFLHRNYVGDSVLADNVLMGAGAVLANFRFDEKNVYSIVNGKKINSQRQKLGAIIGKNCRIGVNVTILPGVKIGKNTFIGPGEIVRNDLEENKFFYKNKILKNKFLKE
jgi:bifunctional UDP-N-acetylglucosamine pyrophosphorylase/glucosamine-1-phosphate N-acetyltransferase